MHTMTPTTDQSAIVCQRFDVIGMTCGHCEQAIAARSRRSAGRHRRHRRRSSRHRHHRGLARLDVVEIAAAVDEAGYELAR